jgi:hypothetical protein
MSGLEDYNFACYLLKEFTSGSSSEKSFHFGKYIFFAFLRQDIALIEPLTNPEKQEINIINSQEKDPKNRKARAKAKPTDKPLERQDNIQPARGGKKYGGGILKPILHKILNKIGAPLKSFRSRRSLLN